MTVADLQSRLDEAREKAGVVGASIAVLHGEQITAAASGLLNRATGVEATTDSLFQIGSITKTYTATVVMQLVEQGLVDLDAPVTEVLPEFRVADAAATSQITVRHLLTHASGFDGDHFADYGRGDDVLERYAASCAQLGQVTAVGELFSYNNAAFGVLGRVIEQVTGQVWDAAMRERLFAPLGLAHTATLPEDVLRFRAAMGHLGPDVQPAPQWGLARAVGPAGLICSTAADVVSFARMHLSPSALLSTEWVQAMQQPHVDIPVPKGGSLPEQQCLGWMASNQGGVTVVGHDGGTLGQSARLRFVPTTGTAVALLTNGGDALRLFALVDELLHELTGAVAHPVLEPRDDVAPGDLARWTGRYARTSHSVDVRLVDDTLVAHHEASMGGVIPMSFSAELVPYEPDRGVFLTRIQQLADAWMSVTFLDTPSGRRLLHFGGRATPLVSP
jgi:CubicO group peptidase (beta-lactamase class C family)